MIGNRMSKPFHGKNMNYKLISLLLPYKKRTLFCRQLWVSYCISGNVAAYTEYMNMNYEYLDCLLLFAATLPDIQYKNDIHIL